jgi:hypothetical protein
MVHHGGFRGWYTKPPVFALARRLHLPPNERHRPPARPERLLRVGAHPGGSRRGKRRTRVARPPRREGRPVRHGPRRPRAVLRGERPQPPLRRQPPVGGSPRRGDAVRTRLGGFPRPVLPGAPRVRRPPADGEGDRLDLGVRAPLSRPRRARGGSRSTARTRTSAWRWAASTTRRTPTAGRGTG